MALLGSLSAGASGVTTFGRAMTVVGSNIANVNTAGYKASRVSFEDILSSDFVQGTGKTKVSQGVNISSINADLSQGSFEQTGVNTDLAINGDGFFRVQDRFGKSFFTRAGQFTYDKDGYLSTDRGLQVQTKTLDPITGSSIGEPQKLKVLGIVDPPQRTGDGTSGSGIKVEANLDANAPIKEIPFDPTNVQNSMYNFSTTVTVFDDLGDEHTGTLVYRRRPNVPPTTNAQGQTVPGVKNQWEWYLTFDGADLGQRPGQQVAVGGGFMQYDDDGRLMQATGGKFAAQPGGVDPVTNQPRPAGPPILQPAPVNPQTGIPQVTIDFGGSSPQVVGISMGLGSNPKDPLDDRTGLDGVTQFASASKVSRISADGHPSGTLEDVVVQYDGTVTARFDSGYSRNLARITLSKFDNPGKLVKTGDNLFQKSASAGNEVIGDPGIGGFGQIRSQTLEQSNVDLAKEFVKMVENQRGFQANAKTVTTSDEMLQDLVGMKR